MTFRTADETLVNLRNIALGPYQFANIQAMFELGIVDLLRQKQSMTAQEISVEAGIDPEHVYQLMLVMIKEGLVGYNEKDRTYAPTGLGDLTDDECARVSILYNMVSATSVRQLYYLADSVRERRPVGLSRLYGFDGTLYEASAVHKDLMEAWAPLMNMVSSIMDPWFLEHVDVGPGARVLDVAGNTGLGAINTYNAKRAMDPRVTCFDLPGKEAEALENFRAQGLEGKCSFVAGNVLESLPAGFDVVMIKNFLEMFDPGPAHSILRNVHQALRPGGHFYLLAPVYAEDPGESRSADFFPGYFLGCAMGQGGLQTVSTYSAWLRECGFEVTKTAVVDTASLSPEGFYLYATIGATRA
jgi:SAM-dependent methyltransferase